MKYRCGVELNLFEIWSKNREKSAMASWTQQIWNQLIKFHSCIKHSVIQEEIHKKPSTRFFNSISNQILRNWKSLSIFNHSNFMLIDYYHWKRNLNVFKFKEPMMLQFFFLCCFPLMFDLIARKQGKKLLVL